MTRGAARRSLVPGPLSLGFPGSHPDLIAGGLVENASGADALGGDPEHRAVLRSLVHHPAGHVLPPQPHLDAAAGQARPVGPEAESRFRRAAALAILFEVRVGGITWGFKGCPGIHWPLRSPAPSPLESITDI